MTSHHAHIVFTGGGTGGHLFPGVAVAEQTRRALPGVRITFVGSGKAFERRHVADAGFDYLAVPCHALPRRPWRLPAFLAANLAGYMVARRFLREECVGAVVGLGGYASVPIARAAKGCGAKLLLLEQNVLPGRATRWLARSADAVCLAFEATAAQLRSRVTPEATGTPVRPGFVPRTDDETPNGRRRLLILGGSGGAESLNQGVPRALYRIRHELTNWEIVHQSGETAVESTQLLYNKLGLDAMVMPFVRNMGRVLGKTDLAVCRAGGSTLAELAAVGVPAVLLPYPHATGDHQRHNAELFRVSSGCIVLDEREVAGRLDEPLADAVVALVADEGRRQPDRVHTAATRAPRRRETRGRTTLCGLLGIQSHHVGISPPLGFMANHTLDDTRRTHRPHSGLRVKTLGFALTRWRHTRMIPAPLAQPPSAVR